LHYSVVMNNLFSIVLVEPQIPQNTGNIVRLCDCVGCELLLVGKLGFFLTDKHLKRAGLDYWDDIKIHQFETLEELENKFPENNFYYISTKGKKNYTQISFKSGDFLVFGSETKGLPKELIENNQDRTVRIPMRQDKRSLNLSNSVAVVLYEAVRQVNISNSLVL
jgi:tRNA (cytidine/uridine-2'-O-)-methyltransferase